MNQIAFSTRKAPMIQCKSRRKDLPLLDCVDSYVDANAIPNRRSACFRCLQGQRTRADFAGS